MRHVVRAVADVGEGPAGEATVTAALSSANGAVGVVMAWKVTPVQLLTSKRAARTTVRPVGTSLKSTVDVASSTSPLGAGCANSASSSRITCVHTGQNGAPVSRIMQFHTGRNAPQ